mmetsp:Transcript_22496/g.48736  ORF Transcript_22496/g.48736 Transcript_22496/m.48736 type:complete len:86 (+) Transcript_22496:134-391(+)
MMSRILIVVLALFAISDIQVASARLGKHHHVHVPSGTTSHSKVRTAHQRRRHLAVGTGNEVADQLKIVDRVERPTFWENVKYGLY